MGEEKYLPELMAEKDSLDPSFVHASRLLAEGRTGQGTYLPASGREKLGRAVAPLGRDCPSVPLLKSERSAGCQGSSDAELLEKEAPRSKGRVV